jgi:hypothetical protein
MGEKCFYALSYFSIGFEQWFKVLLIATYGACKLIVQALNRSRCKVLLMYPLFVQSDIFCATL